MFKKIIGVLLLACLLTGCLAKENFVNLEQDSGQYVAEDDHQQYWNYYGATSSYLITKGDGGYYYYDENRCLICYYDLAAASAVPLCDQPNCEHNTPECNAYTYGFDIDYLQYYHSYLYAIGGSKESAQDVCVYRISADGTTRQNIGTIFTLEGDAYYSNIIHRGYVYCALSIGGLEKSAVNVYRFCLDGNSEAEVIYTTESRNGSEMRLNAQGNYLYMQFSYFTDALGNGYTSTLYRYQIHNGESELVSDKILRDYVVSENNLYYDNGTQIVAYELTSQTESAFVEAGMPVYLICGGRYLIYDNGCGIWISEGDYGARTITVCDGATGMEIATIPMEGEYSELIGTDGENLIAMIPSKRDDSNTYDTGFYLCSIEKAIQGDITWEEFI